jgi:hypothetical protein
MAKRKWTTQKTEDRATQLPLKQVPIELETKDTTDTDKSASYLDLHLEIDSEGRLKMKLCQKTEDRATQLPLKQVMVATMKHSK